MTLETLYWNGAAFPSQGGLPVEISRAAFETCCCDDHRYKCDSITHVCSQTDEPLGNPDVYASLSDCMAACGEPCDTEGCDFQVQFYYLAEWGVHSCNRAIFDAYAGWRPLGEVNLNNQEDGGSRFSPLFDVTAADFIAATCSYSFMLLCKLSSCHQGIAGLRFYQGGSIVLDLPSRTGDRWGVSANDICNPAP